MNLFQIASEIVDNINRTPNEPIGPKGSTKTIMDIAYREVNAAVLWANRSHAFKFAEERVDFVYTANTFKMPLSSVGLNGSYGLVSIEFMDNPAVQLNWGLPIDLMPHESLFNMRKRYFKQHTEAYPLNEAQYNAPTLTVMTNFQDYITNDKRYVAFMVGNSFGLFNTPINDVQLKLVSNSILPPLVADDDTNFLLQYGWDFILSKALKRMSLFMKEDIRIQVTAESLNEDWQSLLKWDSNLRTSTFVEI